MWSQLAERRVERAAAEGRCCLAAGDLDLAEKYFRRATAVRGAAKPDIASARIGLGRVWLRRGDTDRAAREFRTAQRLHPGSGLGHYWAGCAAAHGGDYLAAHDHFTAALAREPRLGRALVQRAYAGMRLGRTDSALTDLVAADRLSALDDRARLALAALWLYDRKWQQALEALQAVRRTDLAPISCALSGFGLEQTGRPEAAYAAYTEAIARGNTRDQVLSRHGRLAARLGQVTSGADSWAVLRDRHPGDETYVRLAAIASVTRAGHLLSRGDVDAATDQLTAAARDLHDDPRVIRVLATAEFSRGAVGRAARLWYQLLRTGAGGDELAWRGLAVCKMRLGAPRQALDDFIALADAEPGGWFQRPMSVAQAPAADRQAWRELALLLHTEALGAAAGGRWDRAAALVAASRQLGVHAPGSGHLEATVYLMAGRRDAAIRLLADASRRQPADGRTGHMLSLALLHTLSAGDAEAPGVTWPQYIASWAVLLHNEAFWKKWQNVARQRYQTAVSAEAVASFRDRLRDFVAARIPAGDDAAGGSYQILFRREIEAAKVLATFGGFPLPRARGERLAAGPLRIAEIGLQREFGAFAAGLASRPLVSSAAGPEPDPVVALLHVFSALGVAHCHLLADHPQEALAAVSDLRCARCRAGATPHRELAGGQLVCAAGCVGFRADNPAFAALPDSRARFTKEALSLALEALQRTALAALAKTDVDLRTAVQCWERAVALEIEPAERHDVQRAIGSQALGRAQVLARRDKLDDAIALLESACKLTDPGERARISGFLATLFNNRGVAAINADPRQAEAASADIARATELNPYRPLIWLNLCQVVKIDARQKSRSGNAFDALIWRSKVRQCLSKALEYNPGDASLKRELDAVNGSDT